MKHDIDIIDYFLIGSGILLLPVFGLGLIPIGAGIFRIGDKMQRHKEQTYKELDRFDEDTDRQLEEMSKKYDIDYIDENVLRELK